MNTVEFDLREGIRAAIKVHRVRDALTRVREGEIAQLVFNPIQDGGFAVDVRCGTLALAKAAYPALAERLDEQDAGKTYLIITTSLVSVLIKRGDYE